MRPSDGSAPPPAAGPLRRRLWMALGYAALGLGLVGVVLPLLPTTPFLLLAAGAFAKGNPALRERLYGHPRFGQLLRDWDAEGAIPRRAKAAALTGLGMSWLLLAATMDRVAVVAGAGLCMALVALYIATRPAPSAEATSTALQNEA